MNTTAGHTCVSFVDKAPDYVMNGVMGEVA
jgi:hypothetical protein